MEKEKRLMEATPYFKAIETIIDKLDSIEFIPGQMIVCSDTGEQYFDTVGGGRQCISDFIVLELDSDRTELENPIAGKMYLIKQTNCIWRYDSAFDWIQITSPKVEIIRNSIYIYGESNTIYFDDDFDNYFDPNNDTLVVYYNSVLLMENIDYDIEKQTNGIYRIYSSKNFIANNDNPSIIHYILYKNTGSTEVYNIDPQ